MRRTNAYRLLRVDQDFIFLIRSQCVIFDGFYGVDPNSGLMDVNKRSISVD